MKKRILSLVLVATMLCSLFGTIEVSASSKFSDVNGHWAQETIEELAGKGIINGKGDGRYDPEGNVTRAEFSKLLMSTLESSYSSVDGELVDVPKDAWYNPFIYAAFDNSIFYLNELNNNFFLPDNSADRETVAVWAIRLLGVEGDSASTPFVDNSIIGNKSAVATAYNNGIIFGDAGTNQFRPDDTLTRAEAATIIKRVIVRYAELNTLRPSKNIVEYKEGLNEIEATESVNILSDVDQENGKFTFTNINDEIRSLKVDDLFVIKPCDAIPTGIAIKVKRIDISRNKATITQGDISFEDVITDLDMAAQIPVSSEYIVEGSVGEGVKISSDSSSNGNYLADAGDNLLAAKDSFGDKFSISFDLDYEIEKGVKLEGKFSLKDFVVNCDVSGKKAKDIKIKLTEKHTEESSISISGSKKWDALRVENVPGQYDKRYKAGPFGTTEGQYTHESNEDRETLKNDIYKLWQSELGKSKGELKKDKQFKKDIKLASINLPTPVAGLFVIFDIKLNVNASGEVSASITNTRTVTRGFEYKSGSGINKISKTNQIEQELDIAGEFDAKAGISLSGGITYLYIVTVDIGIDGGIGFAASTEFGSSWGTDLEKYNIQLSADLPFMDSITTEIENGEARASEIHTCDICVDAVLYGYLSIDLEAKLGYGIFEITLFNPKWEILNKSNAKLATGYLYFDHNSDPFLGMGIGRCVNKYTTPKINEQSKGKECRIGDDMTIFIRTKNNDLSEKAKDQGIFTNKTSELTYQWYKDNIAIEGASSDIYQDATIDKEDAGVYKCIVALKKMPIIYVISDDIEITIDSNTLTGGETSSSIAKTSKYAGSVSENNPKTTFSYNAPVTGTYYFVNGGNYKVFINVDGDYKTNEGKYELVGGHTYTVSVEWYLDDTNYSINIFAPNSSEDISGNVKVNGTITFDGEVKSYMYAPTESGDYTFTADSGILIQIIDASGNEIGKGNPHAEAYLSVGTTYRVLISSPSNVSKKFTMNLSK